LGATASAQGHQALPSVAYASTPLATASMPAMARPNPVEPPLVAQTSPPALLPILSAASSPVQPRPLVHASLPTISHATVGRTARGVAAWKSGSQYGPISGRQALGATELAQGRQALPPVPTTPLARGKEYRVRPGDTLFTIAQRQGTTVATLAAMNGL